MRAKAEIYAPDLNRSGVLAKYQVLHFFVCRFRRGFGEGDRIVDLRGNFAVEFCELLGGISESTKANLEALVCGESGANACKKDIATRSKAENQDAIHDCVHEACKDEARHAAGFYGLLKRYFG